MKLKLLLCGAALLLAAGCVSQQNQFASGGDFSYQYDLVPSPLPDLTPAEVEKIEKAPGLVTTVSPSGALTQDVLKQEGENGAYSNH
jgi:hypothetical protein